MGLEWMPRPAEGTDRKSLVTVNNQPEEPVTQETPKVNPREVNPYLKDNGSGYPEEPDGKKAGGHQLLSSSLVGDGGASWRLKALKHAQEQAAQEGRTLVENPGRDYLRDVSLRHPEMKAPKVHDSLSWGKQKSQMKDADLISAAVSGLNEFKDDGTFMREFDSQQNTDPEASVASHLNAEGSLASEAVSVNINSSESSLVVMKD